MKCTKCGTEIPGNAKFCPMCGQSAGTAPKFCMNCGSPLDGEMRFCEACGKPVEKLEQILEKEVSAKPVTEEAVAQQSVAQPAPQPVVTAPQNVSPSPAVTGTVATAAVQTAVHAPSLGVEAVKAVGKAASGASKVGRTFKTIGIIALVVAFLIGAAAACLNFFVSPPDETVVTMFNAMEELDYDTMLGCLDSKTEKQIRAVINISSGLIGSLTGFDIDLETLMTLAPALAPMLELPDLGVVSAETVLYADCNESKITKYADQANSGETIPTGYLSDNSIINFLQQYHLSIPGLEKLIAKTAVVKVTMEDGTVGYLPMVNEGWGNWRVLMQGYMKDAMSFN